MAALSAWWWLRGREGRLLAFPLARPVLVVGVALPVIWFAVALVMRAVGSSVATWTTGDAVEESSRFVYLLLYFPLADLLTGADRRVQLVWVLPSLLLGVATWVLWLVLWRSSPTWADTSDVLVFEGIFGRQAGVTRVFFGSQVVFAPALALLVGAIVRGAPLSRTLPAIAFLGSATYIAHTRGLWLAVLAAVGTTVVLSAPGASRLLARHLRAVALAVVAGFVALSALLLSRGGTPGFLRDGSSLTRVDQAPLLVDAWLRSPLWGSGMGASLANGFVRSTSAPWSFELTYHQLLFQVGVLGTALVLWPLAAGVFAGVRATAGTLRAGAALLAPSPLLAVTGIAALLGVYVAAATNPYLLSSVGMTVVALGAALTSGRPTASSARRVVLGPRQRWGIAVGVLVVGVALAALEIRAPRSATPSEGRPVAEVGSLGHTEVPVGAADWATDGDLAARDEPLYAIRPGARTTTVTALGVRPGATTATTLRARLARPTGDVRYDITRWGARDRAPALAVVELRPRSVRTRIVALDGSSRVLANGTVTLPRLAAGARRDVSVLRTGFDDGRRPSLVLLDRFGAFPGTMVTVVGGGEGFASVSHREATSTPAAPSPEWSTDAALVFPANGFSPSGTIGLVQSRIDPRRGARSLTSTLDASFDSLAVARDVALPSLGPRPVVLTGQLGDPVLYVVRTHGDASRVDLLQTDLVGRDGRRAPRP